MELIEQARAVLAQHDLGEPLSLERLSGGYANHNYLLTTDRQELLYRVCRQKDERGVANELAVMEVLRREGFPTACPIARRDGRWVSESEAGPVVVYPFLRGREGRLSPRAAEEIGRALARLGSLPDWRRFDIPNYASLEACRALVARFGSTRESWPDVFDHFALETERLREPLSEPLPRGLVHGDVFPDNTLFRGERLLAIVDFEEVCVDTLMYDVGVAANGFCFEGVELRPDLLERFLAAYHGVRPLSEPELRLLAAYLRWGAHGTIFWHLEHLVERPCRRQLERVRTLMERARRLREADLSRFASRPDWT